MKQWGQKEGDTADGVQWAAEVVGHSVRERFKFTVCSLELGGKDAMIVCADADIDRATDGAVWGAFTLTGQVCISVERCYVEEPAYVVAEVQRGGVAIGRIPRHRLAQGP